MNLKTGEKKLIVISGPTGIGKTKIAIQAAKLLNTVILSADSRQIYKEMTIGTAKPSTKEMESVPHYFIDHISISEEYSAGRYEREGLELLSTLFENNHAVILVGGTGLYIKALCEGLDHFPKVDPKIITNLNHTFEVKGIRVLQEMLRDSDSEYFEQVDIFNHRRLIRALSIIVSSGKKFSSFLKQNAQNRTFTSYYVFLKLDRTKLYKKIDDRVDRMVEKGWLDEVKLLLTHKNVKALQSVGYQELIRYLDGEWALEYAIDKIKQHSRNYAKRQMTWLNKIDGARWFDAEEEQAILNYISDVGFKEDPALFQGDDQ